MSVHPAARVTDRFGHDAGLEGMLAGVAVGALIGVGIVATGGLGAIAVGAALATTGAAGMAGAMIGRRMDGPDTGQLTTGSPNVFINGLPATMVQIGTGVCSKDGRTPQPVMTGSASVFINGRPAARVTDQMACGATIRIGSSNVFIGGPRQSPLCTTLRGDQAALERFRIDAQAASAAYDPPATRKPPEGYRNATPEDLRKLGLSEAMLEHPIDPKTRERSEFRAAVFMNEATGAPLVAYKGTTMTSGADWAANVDQGLGRETFYYDQAQNIAKTVAETRAGSGARLTGHSLGGGMASAGAEASGLPATTFNAAGLNAKTVPRPVATNIDAVYVRGEVLRASQGIPGMPRSAETRSWPLEPADRRRKVAVAALMPLGPMITGAGLATRSVLLHMMGQVDAALSQKRSITDRMLVTNGCP